MIIQDTLGYTFSKGRVRPNKPSSTLQMKLNVNMIFLMIRSDNDTEFKNYTLDEFLSDEGIKHQYSAPYTPQKMVLRRGRIGR